MAYLYGGKDGEDNLLDDFWLFKLESWVKLKSPSHVFVEPAYLAKDYWIVFIDRNPATVLNPKIGFYDTRTDTWYYDDLGYDLDLFNKILPYGSSHKAIFKAKIPLDPIEDKHITFFNTLEQLKSLFALETDRLKEKKITSLLKD